MTLLDHREGEIHLEQPKLERQGSLIIPSMHGYIEDEVDERSYHGSTSSLWSAKEEGDAEAAHTTVKLDIPYIVEEDIIFIKYGIS